MAKLLRYPRRNFYCLIITDWAGTGKSSSALASGPAESDLAAAIVVPAEENEHRIIHRFRLFRPHPQGRHTNSSVLARRVDGDGFGLGDVFDVLDQIRRFVRRLPRLGHGQLHVLLRFVVDGPV